MKPIETVKSLINQLRAPRFNVIGRGIAIECGKVYYPIKGVRRAEGLVLLVADETDNPPPGDGVPKKFASNANSP